MIFVKRNPSFRYQPFGYAIFDEAKFDEWIGLFMEAETLRRKILLNKDMPVGASFLSDFTWSKLTAPEAYAISMHICDGYNKCIGNIPTVESLTENIEAYKKILEE